MAIKDSMKRGTLEMIVLALLHQGDQYGYELCQKMREYSGGKYAVTESSIYPVLYRLIEEQCVSSRTETVCTRRQRVYYHLEPAGAERYAALKAEFDTMTKAIHQIAKAAMQ